MVNQKSDGQLVIYKLCLEAQTAHPFLRDPTGAGQYSHPTAIVNNYGHVGTLSPLYAFWKALFCLFKLMLNVPVDSYGRVGTLVPFYVTFTQNKDVMKKCFKYNHPTKPQSLVCVV